MAGADFRLAVVNQDRVYWLERFRGVTGDTMLTKILLFIPCYNCEKQITRVLSQITGTDLGRYFEHILILDNCSRDKTTEVASKHLQESSLSSFTVAQSLENGGLGGSLKKAFNFSIREGFSHIVVLHGDDQACLADMMPEVQSPDRLIPHAMIIGARFHPRSVRQGYPMVRTFGNIALNTLTSIVVRRRIYDLVAGLNVFSVDYLRERFYLDFPDDLTFDFHCLLHACTNNRSISFVPITWREEDQVSNAKAVRQGLKILSLLASAVMSGGRLQAFQRSARVAPANLMSDPWRVIVARGRSASLGDGEASQ
jgi:dolichol-phosphate mannosyltransferase